MGRKEDLEELEDLEHAGARFRNLIVRDPRAADEIRRARTVFLEEVERRNASSGARRASARGQRRWLPLIVSVSVAAGVAATWGLTRPVTFQIGEARQGNLGSIIEATEGRTVPVSFSEGSTLVLHDGGRIRVLSLNGEIPASWWRTASSTPASIITKAPRHGGSSKWVRIR